SHAGSTPCADAEEAVGDWLSAHGVEPAWELAAPLVRAGLDEGRLRALLEGLPAEAAQWLPLEAAVTEAVDDIADAASRVSGIVDAVKRYSHLDEAPVQDIDVHDELERTLRVLRHKLGEGIAVVRDYAPDLPAVLGDPVALNQVWTNLIDNAVDAMGGMGTLTLRTAAAGGGVEVHVGDDGPGLAPHVRDRVFEPFVTTKPVGSGTGLGLHLVWDVVTRVHRGDVRVDSSQAGTVFRVWLPAAGAR
ncbi:MAG TPA: HAMP domain-containing sensor histidine kinase, partial [Egibacteraceae bacterium]|nr:HAMP domain-containing sensor histidine kinase [Egibacteraceae bacterium]